MGQVISSSEVQWIGALLWSSLTIVIAYGASVSMSVGMDKRNHWYSRLKKPPGTPPAWVFSVVWPLLYAAITASIWTYWRVGIDDNQTTAFYSLTLSLYITQLVLNGLWIVLFFVLQLPETAALDLFLVLAISSVKVILFGVQQAWISFGLFLPYVLWLVYALYLNVGIVLLNP